jgi:glycosyltransferase involved in cell wall biosynthesis
MTSPSAAGDTSRPLVSVIVPFLNAGRFLREAIESVRAQTYDRWELMLVDDGSTDESRDVARAAAAAEPDRVRYFQHPDRVNRGTSASRNLGVRHSRGQLIAFLDGDDVWLSGKLDAQIRLLAQYPEAGVLYGETEYWYSWTGNPDDRKRDSIPDVGVASTRVVRPPTQLIRCLLGDATVPCTCSIIVRADVIARVGGWEESFTGMFDDQAFYAKLMLREPVLVATECWDRYRRHSTSMYQTAKREGTVRGERLAYLAWVRQYVRQQGFASSPVSRAVARAMWVEQHPRLVRLLGAHRVRRWAMPKLADV